MASRIPFTISARAARLIGRENVATAQGAVTEIVKNAYDADAKACAILITPSDGEIRETLTEHEFTCLSAVLSDAASFYPKPEDTVETGSLRSCVSDLAPSEVQRLGEAFKRIPALWILDNGVGMSAKIIENQWMVIGTDFKEASSISSSGRVMTGAKGIGRFALDRLGKEAELFSAHGNTNELVHWIVDWAAFEGSGKVIGDVEAILEVEHGNLPNVLEREGLRLLVPEVLPTREDDQTPDALTFDSGTAIRISWLNDNWDSREIRKLRETLEALLPPRDQNPFSIYIYDFRSPDEAGFVDNPPPDQFDYRMVAKVRVDGTVSITLDRQEIDFNKVPAAVFGLPAMNRTGFRRTDLELGVFSYDTSLADLFKTTDPSQIEDLKAVGPFSFTLYFFKLANPTRDNLKRFPQKNFDAGKRRRWLESSGGVRLYRDQFRVRPYGEPNTQSADWLLLGQRVASNPAGASRLGWRVPPQQLAGTVHITRGGNPLLDDQSNREGIANERAFALFRRIIIALINEFERDRAFLFSQFDKAYKDTNKSQHEIAEGNWIASQALNKVQNSTNRSGAAVAALSSDGMKVALALDHERQVNDDLRHEMQVLRGMATLGTVLVSFTHELKQIQANMEVRRDRMTVSLQRTVSPERLDGLAPPLNPYRIVDRWAREDEKVARWVGFALAAISPAKRRRRPIGLSGYFDSLAEYWKDFLASKSATLRIESGSEADVLAHEIDLDSIFYNLIINSVEAFIRPSSNATRGIVISVRAEDGNAVIDYSDDGPGLSPLIKVPEDIFEFGISTKGTEDAGGASGTGIGMWLLKNIVDDYGGSTTLATIPGHPGFHLTIAFPLHRAQGSAVA